MNAGTVIAMRYALRRPSFHLDIDVEIPMHGITGVYGRSGAGKTSLLRCIAGLEVPEQGRLVVAGDTWQDPRAARPVHRREIGYVFQEPRLFDHLDVRGNIEYGARRRRGGGAPSLEAVADWRFEPALRDGETIYSLLAVTQRLRADSRAELTSAALFAVSPAAASGPPKSPSDQTTMSRSGPRGSLGSLARRAGTAAGWCR